jgi:hypothetical protein
MRRGKSVKKFSALVFLIFALFAAVCPAAFAETYTNARFGYSVEYPAFFGEGTELDGGRGMEFKSPDGEYSVEIWGEWNVKDIFGNFADGKKLLSDREFKLEGISEIGAEGVRVERGDGA